MKMIKVVMLSLFVIMLIVAITGIFAPKHFETSRKAIVPRTSEFVYNYLADFNNMNQWSPWGDLDPNTQYAFFGNAGEINHGYQWKSDNNKAGTGEMRWINLNAYNSLDYSLLFMEPLESKATGSFLLTQLSNGTEVKWTFKTDFGFMESIFMLFFDMEKLLGDDFEKGLSNLQKIMSEIPAPIDEPTEVI